MKFLFRFDGKWVCFGFVSFRFELICLVKNFVRFEIQIISFFYALENKRYKVVLIPCDKHALHGSRIEHTERPLYSSHEFSKEDDKNILQ